MITKSNPLDAGYDLAATENHFISSNGISRVHTGVMADIPAGHVGIIKERSSLGAYGVAIRGGVIDAGYTGEIVVLMHHALPGGSHRVSAGDRVAQLVVIPLSNYMPGATSERGAQGFGSTGK